MLESPLMSTMESLVGSIADLSAGALQAGDEFKSGPRQGKDKGLQSVKQGAMKLLDSGGRLLGIPVGPVVGIAKQVYGAATADH